MDTAKDLKCILLSILAHGPSGVRFATIMHSAACGIARGTVMSATLCPYLIGMQFPVGTEIWDNWVNEPGLARNCDA